MATEQEKAKKRLIEDVSSRIDKMKNFDDKDTLDMIISEAEDMGLPEPYLYAGLFYVESDYFSDSPIRCEDNYEEPFVACQKNEESELCKERKSFYDLCEEHCDDPIYCKPDENGPYKGGDRCGFDESHGTKEFHQFSCSYGLTQIMYPVALDMGFTGPPKEIIDNDELAVRLSLKLFNRNLQSLEKEFSGDVMVDAILAYNMGAGTVAELKEKYGPGIESYIQHIDDTTGRSLYIGRILVFQEVFKDIHQGHDLKDTEDYVEKAMQRFNMPPPSRNLRTTLSFGIGFSIDIPYDLNIFHTVRDEAKILAETCKTSDYLDFCIESKTSSFHHDWKYGDECLSGNEGKFYQMVESIQQCLDTPGQSCTCPLPDIPGKFILSEKDDVTVIEGQIGGDAFDTTLDIPLRDANEYINFPQTFTREEIQIVNSEPRLYLFGDNFKQGKEYKPSTQIHTYDKYLLVNKSLSVVEKEDVCITHPKRTYRFCVDDGDLIHKFALTFRSDFGPITLGNQDDHLTTRFDVITKTGGLIQ
ncbi:MAG: hypothetical protein ACLFP2_00455 [Candidatus Woesearchaeota archaeon]